MENDRNSNIYLKTIGETICLTSIIYKKRLEEIQYNIYNISVLSPDRYLHIGLDEGGILGAPTVYLAFDKNKIPTDGSYIGIMHNEAIKKYLATLLFTWTVFGMPDYSKNLNVQFKE